jgi:hypothetical protein
MGFLSFLNILIFLLMPCLVGIFLGPCMMSIPHNSFDSGFCYALLALALVGAWLFLASFMKVVRLKKDCHWLADLMDDKIGLSAFLKSYSGEFLRNLRKDLQRSGSDYLAASQWGRVKENILQKVASYRGTFYRHRMFMAVLGIVGVLALLTYQMVYLKSFVSQPSSITSLVPNGGGLGSFASSVGLVQTDFLDKTLGDRGMLTAAAYGSFLLNIFGLVASFFILFLLLEGQWVRLEKKIAELLDEKVPLWVAIDSTNYKDHVVGGPLFWESLMSVLTESFQRMTCFLSDQEKRHQELSGALVFLSERITKVNEMMKVEHGFLQKIAEGYDQNQKALHHFADVLDKAANSWSEDVTSHIRNIDFSLERFLKDHQSQSEQLKEVVSQELRVLGRIFTRSLGQDSCLKGPKMD